MIFSSEPRWKLLALPTGYSLANAALCVRVSLNVFAQNQVRQVEKINKSFFFFFLRRDKYKLIVHW